MRAQGGEVVEAGRALEELLREVLHVRCLGLALEVVLAPILVANDLDPLCTHAFRGTGKEPDPRLDVYLLTQHYLSSVSRGGM